MGSAAQGAFGSSMKYYSQKLGEAIDAWGMDTVMDWQNKGAKIEQQFRTDLEEMRRKAQMARATNDMEMYKLSMQKILFDKQMLAYADNIKKNNTHSLIAGLVELVGQIGGGVLGSQTGKKKEATERVDFYKWMAQQFSEPKDLNSYYGRMY
jgi:hypothetical protein